MIPHIERFHKSLSDVALYSLGSLCAVSLSQLFDNDCHREFKKNALDKILKHLGQPKHIDDKIFAILEGKVMIDGQPFVKTLLEQESMRVSRLPLVEDMINMAICDGCYDARMRILIKHVAWQLHVTWDQMEDIEYGLAEKLENTTYVMSEEEATEKSKTSINRKVTRYALIGIAMIWGGVLIGFTGGIIAPFVAVGAGAIVGGGGAILGSTAGIAIIGSLFGVVGAGLTGYKMKKRVNAVEEFSFEPLTPVGSRLQPTVRVKQLRITIAVTGWLNEKSINDCCLPWRGLAWSREQYILVWESKYLYKLGKAFDNILQTGISTKFINAFKQILRPAITSIAWPARLLFEEDGVENTWHVCTQRANKAGKQLAEVLLSRQQGNRPVTLIGFSMGARVIFSCLEELSKRKGSEGLVEDAILLGTPVSDDPNNWKQLARVVAGKIVNGYIRGDELLQFVHRTQSVTLRVAGVGPIKWDDRRMHNIDLSDMIHGHMDYSKNIEKIMKAIKDELKPAMPKA